MRRKTGFWLRTIAYVLMLAMVLTVPAAASEQRTGAVRLQFPQEAVGIGMTLYRAAEYEDGGFVYTDEFAASQVEISDLSDASQLQEAASLLADHAAAQNLAGSSFKVTESGLAEFTDLPLGLYLAAQTSGAERMEAQPVLIPLPYSGAQPVYDLTVAMKCSPPRGAVILRKQDETGEAVEGARFALQEKVYLAEGQTMPDGAQTGNDAQGSYFWREFQNNLVSSEYGQIVITDLPLGTFRLVETQVPAGFVTSCAVAEFTVSAGGTVEVTEDGLYTVADGRVEQPAAVNTRTQLIVNKVDASGEYLDGAKLVVRNTDGSVLYGADGQAFYLTTGTEAGVLYQIPEGEYLLSEVEVPEGYLLAADVPFTVSAAQDAHNEVTMVDEKEPEKPVQASLSITKTLEDLDGNGLLAEDAVFYVALFEDEERTKRISGVRPISFERAHSGTAVFTNLDLGKKYYFGETDEFGELIVGIEHGNGIFAAEYPEDYSAVLSRQRTGAEFMFQNVFYEIPYGYYFSGELTITKQTMRGDQEYECDDVFYARVFEDPQFTVPASDIIELAMDGTSCVSQVVEVSVGSEGESVTYYVTETDEYGTPLSEDEEQMFTFTVDQESVTMSLEQNQAEVTITNYFEEEEIETEEETESELQSEEETESEQVPQTTAGETPQSGTGVQTGDETPIMRYAVMLAAALAVLAVGAWMRSRNRKWNR